MSDASSPGAGAIRELLLGMGSNSMRKSYYPELQSKLADLELLKELMERVPDGVMLFSIPANALIFANHRSRRDFGIPETGDAPALHRIFPSLEGSPCLRALVSDDPMPEDAVFIETRREGPELRRYEIVASKVALAGRQYGIIVSRDSTERILMEERIRQELLEKETLLREVHHRVKNNFQLIRSMLALERSTLHDEAAAIPLIESENRIMSMAIVHEHLYGSSNLSSIPMRVYIDELVSTIVSSFRTTELGERVGIACAEISLPLELALPCGLIVNELLTNAIKYAFPGGTGTGDQRIDVTLALAGPGRARLSVADNGVGTVGVDLSEEAETIGVMIVRSLAEQIGGSLRWTVDGGTMATIDFAIPATVMD